MTEIDFSSVFAVHKVDEGQVRWYYRERTDTTAGADRWFGIDYIRNGFVSDVLPYRVFCGGELLPSGAEGPAAAPSSLTHDAISVSGARATWENGDTSPGTRTTVERREDAGSYVQIATLPSGAQEYIHTGLETNETYWTRIKHIRNGQESSTVEASFTTILPTVVPPPYVVAAEDSPYLNGTGVWSPAVLVTWNFAEYPEGLKALVYRDDDGGSYNLIATLAFGEASLVDQTVTEGVTHTYRIVAENIQGTQSINSATAAVVPTVEPYDGWPGKW